MQKDKLPVPPLLSNRETTREQLATSAADFFIKDFFEACSEEIQKQFLDQLEKQKGGFYSVIDPMITDDDFLHQMIKQNGNCSHN